MNDSSSTHLHIGRRARDSLRDNVIAQAVHQVGGLLVLRRRGRLHLDDRRIPGLVRDRFRREGDPVGLVELAGQSRERLKIGLAARGLRRQQQRPVGTRAETL
jgi:hypothetical protein